MIDRVRLHKYEKLDVNKFSPDFKFVTREVYDTARYEAKVDGVFFSYNPITFEFKVIGRIMNIGYDRDHIRNGDDFIVPTRIKVHKDKTEYLDFRVEADDYVEVEEELYDKLGYIQSAIHELTGKYQELTSFTLTQIEVCYNLDVDQKNVEAYIMLFNHIYMVSSKVKTHTNHVIEQDLEWHTSFHMKPNGQYEKNSKTNYVVNFYNKHDQLKNLKYNARGLTLNISEEDIERAKGVLRLEVSVGYDYLKSLRKKSDVIQIIEDIDAIGGDRLSIDEFLSQEMGLFVITDKYKQFISRYPDLAFCTYSHAIALIDEAEHSIMSPYSKKQLKEHLKNKYQRNKKVSSATEKKYRDLLANVGVNYEFIPTRWEVDYLESPIVLLRQKIQATLDEFHRIKNEEVHMENEDF